MRPLRLAAATAVAVALALLVSSCAGPAPASTSSSGRIAVVAGENFWGDIVQQIGGSRVAVTSIIKDPNVDPHEYSSDAATAAAVSSARLVVENGFGYDDFLSKLVDASPTSGRRVLNVQQVLHITAPNANPHIWYDTARLPTVAAAVAAELGAIDPAGAATFTANARRFDASLKPIEAVVARIKSEYAGTKIAYTERVPGYLVQAAGLKLGMPIGFTRAVENGTDPAPADNAAFDAAITHKTVKLLLYNAQVTDAQTTKIKQLAMSSGVPVVGVTETMPPQYATFQAWQLAQAQQILAALAK